jgi:enoyl-CoA hydratase/carnithine racemase
VSGADFSQFAAHRSSEQARQKAERLTRIRRTKFQNVAKPMIARIRGFCLGGGLAIAMQTDLRIAPSDSEFGASTCSHDTKHCETHRCDDGGPCRLINQMVLPDHLNATVTDIARTIADNAPLSVAASKLTISAIMKDPAERDMNAVRAVRQRCLDSEDFREGVRAFRKSARPSSSVDCL